MSRLKNVGMLIVSACAIAHFSRSESLLMASGGRSFFLAQGRWAPEKEGAIGETSVTRCLPIFKAGRLVKERFCAFALQSRRNDLTDAFTRTLAAVFEESYPKAGTAAE